VKSYPPKASFLEDHVLAPMGCCAPKFLHAPENYKVLLAHIPTRDGGPFYKVFQRGSKIGLKCSKGALIALELGV